MVDDDRAGRRALRADLEAAGFGVLEAADGEAVRSDQRDEELHRWLRDLGALDVVGRSHDIPSLIRHLEESARSINPPRISLTAS